MRVTSITGLSADDNGPRYNYEYVSKASEAMHNKENIVRRRVNSPKKETSQLSQWSQGRGGFTPDNPEFGKPILDIETARTSVDFAKGIIYDQPRFATRAQSNSIHAPNALLSLL